jgi:hypothetical protein
MVSQTQAPSTRRHARCAGTGHGATCRSARPVPLTTTYPKAGVYFKNVTTSTSRISADDFIGAMGVMTDALGLDCADCHPGAGTDKVNFAIDTIPDKVRARKMIEMVATINQTNFAGVQSVTCWTCHRQQTRPATSIALDHLYEAPNVEDPDIPYPGVGKLTATQILDRYIQAVGGAQRLAGLTSFVATGVSVGYGDFGGDGEFTIYAKSPNLKTTTITFKDHPERATASDRRRNEGVGQDPRGFLPQYELVGGELSEKSWTACWRFLARSSRPLSTGGRD